MTLEEFRQLDCEFRQKRPKPFLLTPPDPKAEESTLFTIENEFGFSLPICYRQFLKEFGGGNFGFINVFSAEPQSEWYLPAMQKNAREYIPDNFLAFSDDYSGGYYGFKISTDQAMEPVFYWNTDGGLVSTDYANVFNFIIRFAYEPA